MNVENLFGGLLYLTGTAAVLYYAPYLIRAGWGKGQHVTKKVCDRCFRDIARYNAHLKQQNLAAAGKAPTQPPKQSTKEK